MLQEFQLTRQEAGSVGGELRWSWVALEIVAVCLLQKTCFMMEILHTQRDFKPNNKQQNEQRKRALISETAKVAHLGV